MVTYEYQCGRDGPFDRHLPLGTAPETVPCPMCGQPAHRRLSAPRIVTGSRAAWTAAQDRADKSRFEPDVVTSLPPTGAPRRTVALTPKLRGLPRP